MPEVKDPAEMVTATPLDSTEVSVGQRVQALELAGYAVVPGVLAPELRDSLRAELEPLPLAHTSYSDKQWYVHDVQWRGGPCVLDLLAHPAMLGFLRHVFGDDLACVSATFARTDPGYCGMALHTDSQPYGSDIFGARASSPVMLRVLYYLDDLTPDCAPLRVVPYSHLSLHRDANPYARYRRHPEELIVTCSAGDAVIINQKVFHAVGPNLSSQPRSVFAVGYRPRWAGPVVPVEEPSPEMMARLPANIRELFADPNQRITTTIRNWSEEFADHAAGLGASRWAAGAPKPRESRGRFESGSILDGFTGSPPERCGLDSPAVAE